MMLPPRRNADSDAGLMAEDQARAAIAKARGE